MATGGAHVAPWFFALLGVTILILLFIPQTWDWIRGIRNWMRSFADRRRAKREAEENPPAAETGAVVTTIALFALVLSSISCPCLAAAPDGFFEAADSVKQQWQVSHHDSRLSASGTIALSGHPGDRFLLLRAPAVLTRFDGEGLRLTKQEVPGQA